MPGSEGQSVYHETGMPERPGLAAVSSQVPGPKPEHHHILELESMEGHL